MFNLHFKNWWRERLSPSRLTPNEKLLQNHFSYRLLYVRPPPPTDPFARTYSLYVLFRCVECSVAASNEETFEKNWFDWLNQVKSGNCCFGVLIWLNAHIHIASLAYIWVDRFHNYTDTCYGIIISYIQLTELDEGCDFMIYIILCRKKWYFIHWLWMKWVRKTVYI